MKLKFYPINTLKMLIEYFDIIEKKIQYLIEVRSTLKIGDRNYEEHLKTIKNNIHNLQVEQDKLFTNK